MKKKIITISIVFTICLICGIQNISAQQKGAVVYTQGTMTGIATLQGTLIKKKWMYFVLDFPNGKPGFNVISSPNLAKFNYILIKPGGTILTDISAPLQDAGKYRMIFKLKAPWSNKLVPQGFKMVISLE